MQIDDRFEDSQVGGTFTASQTADESTGLAATTPGLTSTECEKATHAAVEISLDDLGADFGKYCEENSAHLLRTAFRITGNPWDAQDALQNVLEKFWKKWPEENFRNIVWSNPAYSRKCVVSSAIDAIRSETSRARREEKDARKEVENGDDYLRVDDEESFGRTLDVLHSLNPTWRLVIHLRYAREYSIVEVAAILRISEATARRYEKRALKALEEAYKGN
ncbi:sigma-70 family RNA polymerase sigma factor [Streptomyces sp. NBC_01352]|uniref:RNA polymerase sigma factor n=1 Tax=Streptomyces sp. NBC_01352 TaxID=2903834 RepID=UPI002E35E77D|nr:sigma-70 family RNA polymerase sigma factor [Streptomyces sp. NBC_01352]